MRVILLPLPNPRVEPRERVVNQVGKVPGSRGPGLKFDMPCEVGLGPGSTCPCVDVLRNTPDYRVHGVPSYSLKGRGEWDAHVGFQVPCLDVQVWDSTSIQYGV